MHDAPIVFLIFFKLPYINLTSKPRNYLTRASEMFWLAITKTFLFSKIGTSVIGLLKILSEDIFKGNEEYLNCVKKL